MQRKRSRTSTRKVKSGCHTCKSRHLKCDELRPACMKCIISQRTCPGYSLDLSSTSFARNDKMPRFGQTPRSLPQVTTQEQCCLEYFHHKTTKELPGRFPSGFWDCLVVQACRTNEPVLHLSIALGALHRKACEERMTIPSQDVTNGSFQMALLQYNKAVCLLSKLMSSSTTQQDREICLIACVMLICFEILRGHYGTAMVHLGNGRKVLTEHLFGTGPHDTLVLPANNGIIRTSTDEDLSLIFARLDIQGAHFGFGSPQFKLCRSASEERSQFPESFKTSREARTYLDILTNTIEKFLTADREGKRNPTHEATQCCTTLLHQLWQWSQALLPLETGYPRPSPEDLQRILLLRLLHDYLHIKLSTAFTAPNTELAYDNHTPAFEALLNRAGACLSTATAPLPSISLDNTGVIQPLYFTAMRCRDPQLRRRAVALLWATPHREGMWDATLEAMVAARTILLEEEIQFELQPDLPVHAPPPFVVENARFQAVYILLRGEGDEGGDLYCTQRRDRGCGKPGIEHPGLPEDLVVYQHDLDFDSGVVVRRVLEGLNT